MHLIITQPTDRIETVENSLVKKLYLLSYSDASTQSLLDDTSMLSGHISVRGGIYESQYEYLTQRWPNLQIDYTDLYMSFVDSNVEAKLIKLYASEEGGITESLAKSITNLPSSLFKRDTSIQRFPELDKFGVTRLDGHFEGCTNLYEIGLSNITHIEGTNTFRGSSLKHVYLPNIIIMAGFYQCTLLETVTLGANVTSLGWACFSGCSSLKSVKGVENVNTLRAQVFLDTPSMNPIMYLKECTSIVDGSGGPFCNTGIKEIYMPKIKSTPNNYSWFLSNQWRPQSVTLLYLRDLEEIYAYVFYYVSLDTLVINNDTPPTVIETANNSTTTSLFANGSVSNIYVPDNAVDTYKAADHWSEHADKIKPLSEMPKVSTEEAYDALKEAGDTTVRLIEAYVN